MSRNGLKEDIIEATECLKAWWQVIERPVYGTAHFIVQKDRGYGDVQDEGYS